MLRTFFAQRAFGSREQQKPLACGLGRRNRLLGGFLAVAVRPEQGSGQPEQRIGLHTRCRPMPVSGSWRTARQMRHVHLVRHPGERTSSSVFDAEVERKCAAAFRKPRHFCLQVQAVGGPEEIYCGRRATVV
ncbi:hypothetical protein PV04_03133 [Phialophora macrospora]|uniref:Uncharacterized protein n=1 Tax=Phialophora macrospora TaxID=1851006 RepID=A0A0D2E9B2_9EURO|nr:hypothetical protein PV04_03133 [Phialophora macrospora]